MIKVALRGMSDIVGQYIPWFITGVFSSGTSVLYKIAQNYQVKHISEGTYGFETFCEYNLIQWTKNNMNLIIVRCIMFCS